MKQTAVQWLLDNLILVPWTEEHFKYNSECWDKALEMEKEQMFKALIKGNVVYDAYDKELEFEEYYNETYEAQEN